MLRAQRSLPELVGEGVSLHEERGVLVVAAGPGREDEGEAMFADGRGGIVD
jgi:hypothetical protein